MQLTAHSLFRLYGVSDTPNESGEHPLESFGINAFNVDISASDLDDTLNDLADATYGQGSLLHEVTDDNSYDNGKVYIDINDDDRLEIQDITDKIATDSEDSRFYILVNAQLTEFCWVVAEPKGAVYSG